MGISSVSWPKPFPPRPKRDWNLPKRWRGLTVSDVRTCPTPYAQDALAQPSNRILAPRYRASDRLSKPLPCQAEFLASPINASFIRSFNIGQNDSDTKESTRISNKLKTKGFIGSKCPFGRHRKPAGAAFVLNSAAKLRRKIGILQIFSVIFLYHVK